MSNAILTKSKFIHIPKCGGTAIQSALWNIGCIKDVAQVIRKPHDGHLFAHQMPKDGLPCFAFIRHPVAWWMSFYHWNMHRVNSRFSAQELQTKSFDEWVQDYGPFWLGQYTVIVRRYLGDDPVYHDGRFNRVNHLRIGKMEEGLFSELRRILNHVGEPYNEKKLDALIKGAFVQDDVLANRQVYERYDVSAESIEVITKAELFMFNTFNYNND